MDQKPPLYSPLPQDPNANAYAMTAAVGLLVVALRQALGGGGGLPDLFTLHGLSALVLQGWPELLFALGLLGQRRWARDLASPLACLGMAQALAELPRYALIDWRIRLSPLPGGSAIHTWSILRFALGQQALLALVCAGTFYALTRPALIRRCQSLRAQPTWTDGLSFWTLLLLSHEITSASDLSLSALVQAPALGSLFSAPGFGPKGMDLSPASQAALAALALLALALCALIGLWKRRCWGWLLLVLHCLYTLYASVLHGLDRAFSSYFLIQDRAAAAALPAGLEGFSRELPTLAALALVALAALKSRREFRT